MTGLLTRVKSRDASASKNPEPKSQNNELQGRPIAPNSVTFVGDKRPLGKTRNKFGSLGSH